MQSVFIRGFWIKHSCHEALNGSDHMEPGILHQKKLTK